MKIVGYVLLGYLLLQIFRQQKTLTGANVGSGVLGQLLSFTPAQFQAVASGVASGQVTGLTTDQSGDLVVSVDPNAGADPLGLNNAFSGATASADTGPPTTNAVIGAVPGQGSGLTAIQGLV